VTGFAEGTLGASPINWAILIVGDEHTGKIISYNGIASYGALAVGASLGVIIDQIAGLPAIGILITLIGLTGWAIARRRPAIKSKAVGIREPFLKVFRIVTPYGATLAIGGLGFGSISTFITLYYASNTWSGAVYCLSVFSIMFILGRIAFESAIDKYGGMRTAIACLSVEALGLLVIWQAPNPALALTGAGIAGFGFSLLFPALGVMAVKAAPAANRGSALAGYGLFIDLSLGLTGPLFGFVAGNLGMNRLYAAACIIVLIGLLIAIKLDSILFKKTAEETKM
jgi:predicted MFS family arabinose efflux permease